MTREARRPAVDLVACPGGVPRRRLVLWRHRVFGSRPCSTPIADGPRSGFNGVSLTDIKAAGDDAAQSATAATVYVCITCRRAGDPEDAPRPGLALAQATAKAADGTGVAVRQVQCLANCSRALSAAMRCDGAWTYVFGGLEPDRDAEALIEGAQLLARAEDGVLPWRGRPDILKRGLIARVPPLDFTEENQ